ncbi:branched-chain amino acid ABC transporter permease [Plasticicumulans acidivorans]|uniref:Amino acid/amide ABC transporter membrane protein 1 (HAAT family) n=1 Tax=Plasticicumulans acidivorans TaxID=886464 RepID=A0A317MSC5_9GAMM|nr:branched-chain amino acid ABC transporter permease [Plasticicumulans acidivorans]PWV60113.1 amino acid/amide ABC transporter membrane protein 1 (HAAT family) [Plasticicumulans acidivorans]
MDFGIFAVLAQDGVTNAAVYALLAMALVLVFSVTRIIFLPQGEFIGFGALTLAALQGGQFPRLLWLLIGVGVLCFAVDLLAALRQRRYKPLPRRQLLWSAGENLFYPLLLWALAQSFDWSAVPMLGQILFTLAVTVPLGVMLYRVAFQPLAEASVLVLLIVAVGVHFALIGLGLFIFGPEGSTTQAFTDWSAEFGALLMSGQSLVVIAVAAGLIAALYLFFERTLFGKALRATAVNRRGAQLVGIGTAQAGRMAFALAAALGSLAGILIGPLNTVGYDSGFIVALKGFVAAIVGGLASYPLAAAGALLVGLLESYASFWASAYKEVIVFTLIIPLLAWRSLASVHTDEEGA